MADDKGWYSHRAVAPVIATLLLVAIAVVGGTIISIYTTQIIAEGQISGYPTLELIKILGHDTRDADQLQDYYEQFLELYSGGLADGKKVAGERVAIYVENHSVEKFVINELRFAGKVYSFAENQDTLGFYFLNTAPARGEFVVLLKDPDQLLDSSTPYIEPGQLVTLVVGLDDNIKIGRNAQIKIVSTHGMTFLGDANIGEHSS